MSKALPKVAQAVYNWLPTYQALDLREDVNQDKIFYSTFINGHVIYFLAGLGSILIDIEVDSIDDSNDLVYRVEVSGGKNSWTKNELNLEALKTYNDIQMFLVASHSWVFNFAG